MRASITGFALALLLIAWAVVAETATTAPALSGKLADPVELIGPDLAGWLSPHGRESLGGKPFGTGTPPGPPVEGERVPAGPGV